VGAARHGGGREGGDLGFRGNGVGAFYTCDIGRVSGEGALAWAPDWALSCWAGPSRPFVPGDGPHQDTTMGSCHAQPNGLGVEPGHGPQTFGPGRARARPKMSYFRLTH
jgi:hypothetical protein